MEWPLAALVSTEVTPHPGRWRQMAPARGPVQIVLVGFGWPLTDYIEHYDTNCQSTDLSTDCTDHRKPTSRRQDRMDLASGPSEKELIKVGRESRYVILKERVYKGYEDAGLGVDEEIMRCADWQDEDEIHRGNCAPEELPERVRGCVISGPIIPPHAGYHLRFIASILYYIRQDQLSWLSVSFIRIYWYEGCVTWLGTRVAGECGTDKQVRTRQLTTQFLLKVPKESENVCRRKGSVRRSERKTFIMASESVNDGPPGTGTVGDDPGTKTNKGDNCLLYTSPSPRDRQKSRMPSSA